jgi:hypothetical protein
MHDSGLDGWNGAVWSWERGSANAVYKTLAPDAGCPANDILCADTCGLDQDWDGDGICDDGGFERRSNLRRPHASHQALTCARLPILSQELGPSTFTATSARTAPTAAVAARQL